ncbi:MAG TPA: phosphotransferase [Candidatus Limnocylindria bacterium]
MPQEREDKPPWSAVPTRLKDAVARALGSAVIRARRTYGGYGPSATYALTLADGRRAFFKGTYPLPEGSGVRWALTREAMVYRHLGPVMRPWAPEYLGEVRADGWHGMLLELVDGTPVLPWTRPKAMRAVESYAAFHASVVGLPGPSWLSRTQHRDFAAFWRHLARDEAAVDLLGALAGPRRDEAHGWLRSSLHALRQGERMLLRAGEPHALLHFDTRSDNIVLDGDQLRIFDWPFACVGPPEFDLAAFAQSISAEGGPGCEVATAWYETVRPLRRDVLVGSVVGIAGYFADRAPQPAVPGLPRLRSIQRRQLKASLAWAARLLDLPHPGWVDAVPD